MKSVASTRLLLALVSSALIVQLLVQPITCRHVSHHKGDGNPDSLNALHHSKNHGHEKNVHNNHHTHDKHQENTDPHTLEVLQNQPLGYWPVCSWCHSVNFDHDRVPKVLPIASCCSIDPRLNITGVTVNIHCETIYYSLLVKLKSKDETKEDSNSWEDKWLKVPAGCTPAQPVTQKYSNDDEDITLS